jgi:hypothetical protein
MIASRRYSVFGPCRRAEEEILVVVGLASVLHEVLSRDNCLSSDAVEDVVSPSCRNGEIL